MDNCIHGTDVRNPCGICSSAYSAEEEAIELANGMLNQSAVKRIAKAILAGESLTLAEQRTLVSSHEELRARFLISARMQKALREDLAAEKRRVNEMVSASARMRRA
jgi:hypothetical protein